MEHVDDVVVDRVDAAVLQVLQCGGGDPDELRPQPRARRASHRAAVADDDPQLVIPSWRAHAPRCRSPFPRAFLGVQATRDAGGGSPLLMINLVETFAALVVRRRQTRSSRVLCPVMAAGEAPPHGLASILDGWVERVEPTRHAEPPGHGTPLPEGVRPPHERSHAKATAERPAFLYPPEDGEPKQRLELARVFIVAPREIEGSPPYGPAELVVQHHH